MSNYYDDVRNIVQSHRDLMRAVRSNADALADLLEDNLRSVSTYRLKQLKKKLAAFNANSGKWVR